MQKTSSRPVQVGQTTPRDFVSIKSSVYDHLFGLVCRGQTPYNKGCVLDAKELQELAESLWEEWRTWRKQLTAPSKIHVSPALARVLGLVSPKRINAAPFIHLCGAFAGRHGHRKLFHHLNVSAADQQFMDRRGDLPSDAQTVDICLLFAWRIEQLAEDQKWLASQRTPFR